MPLKEYKKSVFEMLINVDVLSLSLPRDRIVQISKWWLVCLFTNGATASKFGNIFKQRKIFSHFVVRYLFSVEMFTYFVEILFFIMIDCLYSQTDPQETCSETRVECVH